MVLLDKKTLLKRISTSGHIIFVVACIHSSINSPSENGFCSLLVCEPLPSSHEPALERNVYDLSLLVVSEDFHVTP